MDYCQKENKQKNDIKKKLILSKKKLINKNIMLEKLKR